MGLMEYAGIDSTKINALRCGYHCLGAQWASDFKAQHYLLNQYSWQFFMLIETILEFSTVASFFPRPRDGAVIEILCHLSFAR